MEPRFHHGTEGDTVTTLQSTPSRWAYYGKKTI